MLTRGQRPLIIGSPAANCNDTSRIPICSGWRGRGNRGVNVAERELDPPRIGRGVHVLVVCSNEEDIYLPAIHLLNNDCDGSFGLFPLKLARLSCD